MPIDVVLNVYDLIDQTPLCCGFFHTGVEILGVEYSFGQGGGIYECTPKSAPDGRFRESIHMGTIESTRVSTAALDRIRPDFPGDSYNVIFKNCNDFSTALVKASMNKNIPGYINRLARLGRSWPVRCFLPPHLKGNAASPTAPLLAAEPQVQLFQGTGQSLRGTSTSGSSQSTSSARSALKCIGNRFSSLFGQGYDTPSGDTTASNTALIQTDSNARELRAAAAAKRLSGDVEAGEGNGPRGSPMPNPWQ